MSIQSQCLKQNCCHRCDRSFVVESSHGEARETMGSLRVRIRIPPLLMLNRTASPEKLKGSSWGRHSDLFGPSCRSLDFRTCIRHCCWGLSCRFFCHIRGAVDHCCLGRGCNRGGCGGRRNWLSLGLFRLYRLAWPAEQTTKLLRKR